MRSIQARFNKFYNKPSKANEMPPSTYLAFAKAVKHQFFSRDSIARNWMKLVDKEDYLKEEKNEIIDYLYKLSNKPEEHKKMSKNSDYTAKNRRR
jgi:hypothetical protein